MRGWRPAAAAPPMLSMFFWFCLSKGPQNVMFCILFACILKLTNKVLLCTILVSPKKFLRLGGQDGQWSPRDLFSVGCPLENLSGHRPHQSLKRLDTALDQACLSSSPCFWDSSAPKDPRMPTGADWYISGSWVAVNRAGSFLFV